MVKIPVCRGREGGGGGGGGKTRRRQQRKKERKQTSPIPCLDLKMKFLDGLFQLVHKCFD